MSLDPLGVVSAVKIAIYVPIMFFALRLCSRYGVRERGWLLLFIFSLIRIIGGALALGGDSRDSNILDASGLSFLLLSTLGLIEIITEGPSGERKHWHTLVVRILHIVGILALVFIIIGLSPTPWKGSESLESGGGTMALIGTSLLAGLFIVLVAVTGTVLQWASRYRPMEYRKQLLVAVSISLPFIAVRTLYDVLSTLVSYTTYSDPNDLLTTFNTFNLEQLGEWQTYVFMEVVMEYAVVVIYAVAGTVLRVEKDYVIQESDSESIPIVPLAI